MRPIKFERCIIKKIMQKFKMTAKDHFDWYICELYVESTLCFLIFVQFSHYCENYGFSWSWGFRKMCVAASLFLNDGKIQDDRHLCKAKQKIACYYFSTEMKHIHDFAVHWGFSDIPDVTRT